MQQNRCLSCMAEITSFPCPACGANRGDLPDNQLYLQPGIILNNRYLVGKAIGAGGFGIVYIGWDTNLDVRVALKEFLPRDIVGRARDQLNLVPHSNNNMEDLMFGIERFIDEARVLAKFQDHPGIVKVSESFRANNTAYMVMQYLDGMTLKDYLKRQPGERISFEMAIKALTPVMDALREVHKAGFVHRDISPDNIFINRQKQVKLLDFGAARYAMGEHSKSLTSILKQGYAPIEQYNSKGNQGPWTDVYALCATIYKCITGEIPPDATMRVVDECIVSPKQMGIVVPLQGELALMKGLALRAGDRFESIEALQMALGEVAQFIKQPEIGIVHPHRPGNPRIIECPECGAKNQLDPGDNPNALRCGKCERDLGLRPVPHNFKSESNNLVYTDPKTGLMWTRNGNIACEPMTWETSMTWVKNLSYAGYSDWRLPTKVELKAFAERGGNRPSEWLNANGFSSTQSSNYWSSTARAIRATRGSCVSPMTSSTATVVRAITTVCGRFVDDSSEFPLQRVGLCGYTAKGHKLSYL